MTERCDLSDLPVEQCACRIHGPDHQAPAQPGRNPLLARWPGICWECREPIKVGDEIALGGPGYCHEECT